MCPARMSRIELAIRLVLDFHEAFNRHDVAGMMQLASDDCVLEYAAPAPGGTVCSGKGAVTRFWQDFFRSSPRARMEVEEIFGLGIRCVMRWRYEWVDDSGINRHARMADLFTMKDGRISQQLSYTKGSFTCQ